ncbi:MAG: S41 family peptidase [Polyangiaceae bacterium]
MTQRQATDHPATKTTPRSLRTPTGNPASLRCEEARRVVRQAREQLASTPARVDPRPFGEAVIDWLDPHGLWSASPDAPVAPAIRRRARDLVAELESNDPAAACPAAQEIGEWLGIWVRELRAIAVKAEENAKAMTPAEAVSLASSPIFEEGPIQRPARELAGEMGRRLGVIEKTLGHPVKDAVDAAMSRTFPDDDVVWSDVLLGAAVRAYLPQIDPHGGWAPYEEETSLYEVDLEAVPPPRLWRKMRRTVLGVRVEEASNKTLQPGDVVLSVADIPTACLSVEQAEQLSIIDVEPGAPASQPVMVLSKNDTAPRAIQVNFAGEAHTSETPSAEGDAPDERTARGYDFTRLRYGEGEVVVIPIGDVPDDLGDELAATLARARQSPFEGIILDLRGNGGGSTDGAAAAIGLFLPGAQLFPLRRRDGSIEVDRAATPPVIDRWTGPLAVLVDGDTASAAEMIAGALGAYHRAPILGSRTFGKGCAQEYLEDDIHAGVLRLTTLVYALPDGSPVQRTGIQPWITIPMAKSPEKEAMLLRSMAPWSGPDVRTEALVHEIPWPRHGNHVGPCKDTVVCKALRALGPEARFARSERDGQHRR